VVKILKTTRNVPAGVQRGRRRTKKHETKQEREKLHKRGMRVVLKPTRGVKSNSGAGGGSGLGV
jgi:hypothetical protein